MANLSTEEYFIYYSAIEAYLDILNLPDFFQFFVETSSPELLQQFNDNFASMTQFSEEEFYMSLLHNNDPEFVRVMFMCLEEFYQRHYLSLKD